MLAHWQPRSRCQSETVGLAAAAPCHGRRRRAPRRVRLARRRFGVRRFGVPGGALATARCHGAAEPGVFHRIASVRPGRPGVPARRLGVQLVPRLLRVRLRLGRGGPAARFGGAPRRLAAPPPWHRRVQLSRLDGSHGHWHALSRQIPSRSRRRGACRGGTVGRPGPRQRALLVRGVHRGRPAAKGHHCISVSAGLRSPSILGP